MIYEQIIKEVYERAGEYIEMVEHPEEFIIKMLAQDKIRLQEHISYLEKRLSHVSNKS